MIYTGVTCYLMVIRRPNTSKNARVFLLYGPLNEENANNIKQDNRMEKKSDNPEKKIKKEYVAPEVLEVFELDAEVRILASSSVVTEETEVVSTGQEYKDIEEGQNGFGHNWE